MKVWYTKERLLAKEEKKQDWRSIGFFVSWILNDLVLYMFHYYLDSRKREYHELMYCQGVF